MENWNAYMDVLFVLQEIRRIGDSIWLYAIILLLVTAAVILIAVKLRDRRENDGDAVDGDGETDNNDRVPNVRNEEDKNAGDRSVSNRSVSNRSVSDRSAGYRSADNRNIGDRDAGDRNTVDRNVEDRDVGGISAIDRDVGGRNVSDRNTNESGMMAIIIDALGGMDNIYNLACSDTRLRVTVNDGTLVNRMRFKSSGALGVLAKGRQVQVFYEDQVERICGELKRYIESRRYVGSGKEEIDHERVLKKVYVPVEGDVVRVSDIHCIQDVGDGCIGVCAIRAARGEIRAPFDCKVRYSKTRAGQIVCVSKEGYTVEIYLIAEGQRDWQKVRQPINIRLKCDENVKVRKGELLAEYPYETFAGMGDQVYVVMEAGVCGNSDAYDGSREKAADCRCHLRVNAGEGVNYEYVACEIVE